MRSVIISTWCRDHDRRLCATARTQIPGTCNVDCLADPYESLPAYDSARRPAPRPFALLKSLWPLHPAVGVKSSSMRNAFTARDRVVAISLMEHRASYWKSVLDAICHLIEFAAIAAFAYLKFYVHFSYAYNCFRAYFIFNITFI